METRSTLCIAFDCIFTDLTSTVGEIISDDCNGTDLIPCVTYGKITFSNSLTGNTFFNIFTFGSVWSIVWWITALLCVGCPIFCCIHNSNKMNKRKQDRRYDVLISHFALACFTVCYLIMILIIIGNMTNNNNINNNNTNNTDVIFYRYLEHSPSHMSADMNRSIQVQDETA